MTTRTEKFCRNESLESLLGELNAQLWVAEQELLAQRVQAEPEFPLILVMGPLRSGTTLFMQWLANSGMVAYPTNLLSRFYNAPVLGAKIQLLLTDPRYNFRDELGEFLQGAEYRSENGKTRGALAPNEFWYFWRRFLPDPSRDVWLDSELESGMDTGTMLAELSGISAVFGKPFAAKGMLFNYNIRFLDALLKKVLFVHIKRDPVANVASVLEARKRQHGSESAWYSFKIPEYGQLKDLDPVTQSAGQVHYIDQAVSRGLAAVDESRKLVVHYERFCEDPRACHRELAERLGLGGVEYTGPGGFEVSRRVDDAQRKKIVSACRQFPCAED